MNKMSQQATILVTVWDVESSRQMLRNFPLAIVLLVFLATGLPKILGITR